MRPSSHKPGLSADLDSIVLRAMQKHPRHRHASAQELSADVERFLAGQPVIAQEATFALCCKYLGQYAAVLRVSEGAATAVEREVQEAAIGLRACK